MIFGTLALQAACTLWLAGVVINETPKVAADLVTRGLISEESVRAELGDRYTGDRFENMRLLLGMPKPDGALKVMLIAPVLIAGL